jgi:hypothetical protein
MTADKFEEANIDYLIAVEPHEYDLYANKVGVHRLLKLPFSNLGLGSYPARNFCWEHAKNLGNIYHSIFLNYQYYNLIKFKKVKVMKSKINFLKT